MVEKITYKEAALITFAFGVIGLSAAIPGYLKDWNEYKICKNIATFEVCENRAYTLVEPQPRMEPTQRHFGRPIIKIMGIFVAVISFPLSAYAAKEQSENCEYQETLESIEKLTSIQSEIRQKEIDNRVGDDAYEAMKSIEQADLIDRFNQSFYSEVTIEDIEAEEEAEQQKLKQIQEYKQLEFAQKSKDTTVVETSNTDDKKQPQLSEQATAFFNYLIRTSHSSISVRDAVRNSKIVTKQDEMRALMQELHQAELGTFQDDNFTLKAPQEEQEN